MPSFEINMLTIAARTAVSQWPIGELLRFKREDVYQSGIENVQWNPGGR